jgi:hypothetical protein
VVKNVEIAGKWGWILENLKWSNEEEKEKEICSS